MSFGKYLIFFIFFLLQRTQERKKDSILQSFRKWIDNCGFPVNKLEVVYIDDIYEFGTILKGDVQKEELYLSVPFKCIISDELVFDQKLIGNAMKNIKKRNGRDNFYEILLFILAESKDENSFWKPYLDILPPDFNHLPMNLINAQVEFFGMKWLIDEIDEYKEKMESGWELIQHQIFERNPGVFDESIFNWQRFQWAWKILDSRSIWMDGKRHLIPLLDMVNCCGDTKKFRPVNTFSYPSTEQLLKVIMQ